MAAASGAGMANGGNGVAKMARGESVSTSKYRRWQRWRGISALAAYPLWQSAQWQ